MLHLKSMLDTSDSWNLECIGCIFVLSMAKCLFVPVELLSCFSSYISYYKEGGISKCSLVSMSRILTKLLCSIPLKFDITISDRNAIMFFMS